MTWHGKARPCEARRGKTRRRPDKKVSLGFEKYCSWYHWTTLQNCAWWYICNCPILSWLFKISWRQISATSPAATMLTTQCIIATSSDRHGISNYRPIECLFNIFFRLPTNKYLKSALPSLCEEIPLWSVVPAQKESNMENLSIWWRHNGLKDTMRARVSRYAIYTFYYSH